MKEFSDCASALFANEYAALFAVVEKRIQLEWQFHPASNLKRAGAHLIDYADKLGQMLQVVYRHNLVEALREEFCWYVHVFSAHNWGENALSVVLDSWIIAIQGLIKQPECNQLAEPLQQIRDELPGLFSRAGAGELRGKISCDALLVDAALAGDFRRAKQRIMEIGKTFVSPDRLIVELLLPAIAAVGNRWELDQIQIFEEHLATQVFKSLMLSLPTLLPSASAPQGRTVLAGCAPADEHELIPLALSAYLEAKGWNVRNFGSSLPADQIIAAVLALKPSALFLTFTMLNFLDDLLRVLDGLRRDYPECRVVIGGRGALLARPVLESRGALVAGDFASGHRLAVEALAHA